VVGKFVSESKFRKDPAAFIPHIINPNPDALEALIVKPEVEKALLERLEKKVSSYPGYLIDSPADTGVATGSDIWS
jgi:chorismate mutase